MFFLATFAKLGFGEKGVEKEGVGVIGDVTGVSVVARAAEVTGSFEW